MSAKNQAADHEAIIEAQRVQNCLVQSIEYSLNEVDVIHISQYIEQRRVFSSLALTTMNEQDRSAALQVVSRANSIIKHILLIP